MKNRVLRRASLIIFGAMLLAAVPASAAFAATVGPNLSPSVQPQGVTVDVSIPTNGFLFLLSPPAVTFGSGIVVNGTSASGSTVNANISIPSTATPGTTTVTVSDGLGNTGSCNCFTIAPPPTIASVSPRTLGANASTVHFTVTGSHFFPGATVAIGAVPGIPTGGVVTASSPTVSTDNASTMTVDLTPTSAVAGPRRVTVTNPGGSSGHCDVCFAVAKAPFASSFSPAQRSAGMTKQITIYGSGFKTGIQISFSNPDVSIVSVDSVVDSFIQTTIKTKVGAAPGTSDVTFVNPDGGHSTCAACFAIVGPTSVGPITIPSTLTDPITVSFSQPVGGVSSSNTYIRYTGTTTTLPTTITCIDGRNNNPTDCNYGTTVRALLRPNSPMVAGQHYTVFAATSGVTDFGGAAVPAATPLDFRAGLSQEAESVAAVSTWRTVSNAAAYGGSFTIDHTGGATASYRFTGSTIRWFTNVGPSYGIADLYVDGVAKVTVNCYRTTNAYRAAFTITGLSYASHTLTIRVRGAKGSSAGVGTNIAVDAFTTGSTVNTTPGVTYTWGFVKTAGASGGGYIRDDEPNVQTTFTFRGTSVTWYTVLGSSMGRAWVYIDGVRKLWVDNYSATTVYGSSRTFGGLSDAIHTIRIVVIGNHQAAATGSYIAIDRWVVS